jgi:hypothetical protein
MDVNLNAFLLTVANAINIQLMKLSTSPFSTCKPHDGRLSDQHDLGVTNRLIIILDEKLEDMTWNQHQEGFIVRQIVANSVAHACYKTFLKKYPMLQREPIHGVRVTARFASYNDWRAALLANFYDGSRLRQLVLDYAKHLIINPT